jgi:hypothetical protein
MKWLLFRRDGFWRRLAFFPRTGRWWEKKPALTPALSPWENPFPLLSKPSVWVA